MTTALIITTLNEIIGVKKIVPKINKEWVDEIIFVDGGSTDGTIEEARKMGFKVIIQKKKGHGAAVLEGVNSINSDNFILFGRTLKNREFKITQKERNWIENTFTAERSFQYQLRIWLINRYVCFFIFF